MTGNHLLRRDCTPWDWQIAALLVIYVSGCATPPPNAFDVSFADLNGSATAAGRLIIGGDFQRTSTGEFFIGREQNDAERQVIAQAIANENPSAVVSLGDNVFDGSSADEWRFFDRLFSALREKGVPFLTVLGNHEYFGSRARRQTHVNLRFPQLAESAWYTRRWGDLALVFIDSNREEYDETTWADRMNWVQSTLEAHDANLEVRGILVLGHHPPFTRSAVESPHAWLQSELCPRLRASRKVLAYLSGHSHGYERYETDGLMYVVSGGGGGPRVAYFPSEPSGAIDLYGPSLEPRPFNYLKIERSAEGINVTVRGIDKGQQHIDDVRTIDEFEVGYR